MQTPSGVASQLLQEGWSVTEDLFRTDAATVPHLRKCRAIGGNPNSEPQEICKPPPL